MSIPGLTTEQLWERFDRKLMHRPGELGRFVLAYDDSRPNDCVRYNVVAVYENADGNIVFSLHRTAIGTMLSEQKSSNGLKCVSGSLK